MKAEYDRPCRPLSSSRSVVARDQAADCFRTTTQLRPHGKLCALQSVRRRHMSIRCELQSRAGDLYLEELKMLESEWRTVYRAAILELDPKRLPARVQAAEDAIVARAASDARVPRDERREMDDALATLRVLRRKRS